MRHDIHDRQFLLQHKIGPCFLDVHGRAVAAQDFFFVNTHGSGRKLDLGYRIVCGEKQHAPSGPCRCQRIHHDRRMSHCHQDRVSASPLSPSLQVFHKLTISRVKRLQRSQS